LRFRTINRDSKEGDIIGIGFAGRANLLPNIEDSLEQR
jgi:hypothetical protein